MLTSGVVDGQQQLDSPKVPARNHFCPTEITESPALFITTLSMILNRGVNALYIFICLPGIVLFPCIFPETNQAKIPMKLKCCDLCTRSPAVSNSLLRA